MKGGITGHREFKNQILYEWVERSINTIVEEYKIMYGFTCLASGTDQIFAEILGNNKIKYTAIIPCKKYEKTFSQAQLISFKNSKALANEVIYLEYQDASEEAFNEAGKMVVNKSDILIAVWDGKKAKGLGGTADIVDYCLKKKKLVIHIDIVNKVIIKIK